MKLKKISRKIALILIICLAIPNFLFVKANASEKAKDLNISKELKSNISVVTKDNSVENKLLDKARSWIINQRDEDGFWGKDALKLYYTSEIINSNNFNEYKPTITDKDLNEELLNNVDYIARYLMINNDDKYVEKLTEFKKEDGGWGNTKTQGSSIWDTYVMSQYLKTKDIKSKETIQALNYLLAKQNKDGGWSYVNGEESDIYLTANIVCLFNEFLDKTNIASNEVKGMIKKSAEFIENKRDKENFWGLDDKNIDTTLVAMKALIGNLEINYMKEFKKIVFEKQKEEGSWGNNILATKNAIETLEIVVEETQDEINEIILGEVTEDGFIEKLEFEAFERIGISVDLKIFEPENKEFEAFIKDPNGKLEAVEIIDNVITWETKNSEAGAYKILFQVKDKTNNQITCSIEKDFSIKETFNLNNIVNSITPNKVMIMTDTVVKNSAVIYYDGNYNKELKLKGEIKNSEGKIIQRYERDIKTDKNKNSMKIELDEFIPKTNEKTQYMIKNTIYIDGKEIASDENKFNVIDEFKDEQLVFKSDISNQWLSPGRDKTDLLLEFRGSKEGADIEVKPLDLVLILDYSWSMDGNKIDKAVEASKTVIDMIGENDRVAIVKFGSYANVTHGYSSDKESLKSNLVKKANYNGTDIVNALRTGFNFMKEDKNFRPNSNKAVLFLSDGQDGRIDSIRNQAKLFKDELGASISAIGLGNDVEEGALQAMVNATENGAYAYSPTENELIELMMELSGQLFNISAMDVELVLHMNNDLLKLGDIICEREDIKKGRIKEALDIKEQDDGSKVVTWKKDKITFKDIYNFKFEFSGENLPANSKEDLIREGYLKYKNPRGNTEVIQLSNFPIWISFYKVEDKITFDKENYKSNEDVKINVNSSNIAKNNINLKTVYQIVDDKDKVIDTLLTVEENRYSANESKEINLEWNTKNIINGDYHLKISYFEGEEFIFSNSRQFPIVIDGNITNSILTDKELYNNDEEMNLTSLVKNGSQNGVLENLTLENRIIDPESNIVWRKVRDIPILMMNKTEEYNDSIVLNEFNPGTYKIKSILTDKNGNIISIFDKDIKVDSLGKLEAIKGNIRLQKNTIEAYENLDFDYTIKNESKDRLNNVNYRVDIVQAVENKIVYSKKNSVSLNSNQTKEESIIWEHDLLEDGIYAVVLSIMQENGEYKQIAAELFNVSVPCKVNVETRNEWRNFVKSNTIYPQFRVTNEYNENLNLKDFKLRYYYTSEHEDIEEFICDWASIGAKNINGTINKKYDGNKSYLEISFNEGVLKPGETMELHTRIISKNWMDFDQADDYSFNSDSDVYITWDKVTGYFEDKHVYGKEPK